MVRGIVHGLWENWKIYSLIFVRANFWIIFRFLLVFSIFLMDFRCKSLELFHLNLKLFFKVSKYFSPSHPWTHCWFYLKIRDPSFSLFKIESVWTKAFLYSILKTWEFLWEKWTSKELFSGIFFDEMWSCVFWRNTFKSIVSWFSIFK